MNTVIISPDFRTLFAEHQLTSFADFMTTELGDVLTNSHIRNTRRLSLGKETFYLKRIYKEKIKPCIAIYLTGQRPHGRAYREMLQVCCLQQAGLDVMEVAAAGEQRFLGFPCASFVMVRHMAGTDFHEFYSALDTSQRRPFAHQLGQLYGHLHIKGFFASVRLRDIIYQDQGVHPTPRLVLIDREVRNPYPRRFSQRRAINALLTALRRHRKEGYEISGGECRAFISAYADVISSQWPIGCVKLLRRCRKAWKSANR
jgi:Lipopolysaccharide kinase (Kdo/WaaP) family